MFTVYYLKKQGNRNILICKAGKKNSQVAV